MIATLLSFQNKGVYIKSVSHEVFSYAARAACL